MISSISGSGFRLGGVVSPGLPVARAPAQSEIATGADDDAAGEAPSARRVNAAEQGEQTESARNPTAAAQDASRRGLSEQELEIVRELAARDREVRAHEQAHASIGGAYAGSPSYTYQRGPNGRQYAVGGEVQISTSPVPGDPQATIDKARIIRRAALAPAQPSPQDRAVAAQATALEQQAQAELLEQRAESQAAIEGSAQGQDSAQGQGSVQGAAAEQSDDFQSLEQGLSAGQGAVSRAYADIQGINDVSNTERSVVDVRV